MRRVPVLVIAFLALLLLLPLASAAPPIPVPNPDPNSQGALSAQGYSTATTRAQYESTLSDQNQTWGYHVSGKWILTNQHEVLTNWFTGALHEVSASTWINLTHGCSVPSDSACNGYYVCDNVRSPTFSLLPQSYKFTNDCLSLYANWTAGSPYSSGQPQFTIARLIAFVATANQTWITQQRQDFGYANLTSYGYSGFGASLSPSYWAVQGVSWWVPYPAGNWYQPLTTFQSLDGGGTYPQADYLIGTGAFLAQWGAGFPTGSSSTAYHYLFTLTSLNQNTNNTGNQSTNSNQTGAAPPPTVTQIGEVVLTLGNVTQGAREQAGALWLNTFPYNFSGTFYLEGSWLADASNVTLYVNGQPLPSFDYAVSSTAIVVFSGILSILTETEVSFTASFVPTYNFNFYGTLFFLGQYAITPAGIIAALGMAAVSVAVWWVARAAGPPSDLQKGVVAAGLFAFYWIMVLRLA